ncbi:MAG: DinB family protein [Bacteroidetes bacterium]|nr:DinB family protein [Bacteroidota bacterium]MBP6427782.1 DinB family protein [Bacteroidia bacterium]MBP6658578.1 DinB family protein [Bacteroidia bacterium]
MTKDQIIVKMVMDRWNASIENCNKLLNAVNDEQLQREVAPGKNRGIYLLGHLIAVHDRMLVLLNMGEKKYPELSKAFLEEADKVVTEIPSAKDLRSKWNEQKEEMKQKFERLTSDNWFERHTSVSEEDFAKEPHRNKLNILLTRTTHLQYHIGQLVYLK